MKLLLFLTRRFTADKRETGNFSFFSGIVVTGIAIGVAALIIAVSILTGFKQTITEKLYSLSAHVQISGFSNTPLPRYTKTIQLIKEKLGTELISIDPYASRLALISHGKLKEGITLKGVEPDYLRQKTGILSSSGAISLPPGSSGIIIGKTLAVKLRVKPGDAVTVFVLKNSSIPGPENMPGIERYTIAGIIESGMAKYDDVFAYIPLDKAQQIMEAQGFITGLELRIKHPEQADSIAAVLQDTLSYPHNVKTIFQANRAIFTWIELQQKPIPIIMGMIILVAVFNIISALLMLILEKMNAIGILRSMGASSVMVSGVFLTQGMALTITGIIAGNVLAYVLCMLQLQFNIITLPPAVYFVSTVPLLLLPETFLLVSGVTLLLGIGAAILPAFIATRISPVQTLRFS